jgi:hypothetical protein
MNIMATQKTTAMILKHALFRFILPIPPFVKSINRFFLP